MAKPQRTIPPAFQFYPKDFLTSPKVMNMTATERGVYITLLCVCWLEGGLPDDVQKLAAFARLPVKQFARMWPHNLQACFSVVRNGLLINERLDRERKKQIAFRERQAEHGKKGGRRVALPEPTQSHTLSPSTRNMESEDRRWEYDVVAEKIDVAFAAFREAYPEARRKGGILVEQAYLGAVGKAGSPTHLMAALENHKASEQWANPKHIPGMDTWLQQERWRQKLPAAGAASSSANNPKTAGNVDVFKRFVERGKTA